MRYRHLLPGTGVCLLILLASHQLADYLHVPIMLVALLTGILFRQLALTAEYRPGFEFCSTDLLRLGIILLGTRMTFNHMGDLGWHPLALLIVVPATIGFSLLSAKAMKLSRSQGLIAGCAVAICGVAAILAVVAVLPKKSQHDPSVLSSIIGVAGLSTLSMLLFPSLQLTLGWSAENIGLLMGASIHDVAHVVGAGYMVSREVGDAAVYMKMLRVAMLVPAMVIVALWVRKGQHPNAGQLSSFAVPGFLLMFVVVAGISNTGYVPDTVKGLAGSFSSGLLVMAMAAVGARVELTSLWVVGKTNFILLALNTFFISSLAFAILLMLR